MGKVKKKILIFHNSLSPYRIPFFNELIKNKNFEFFFLFSKKKENNRKWIIENNQINFSHDFVKGFKINLGKKTLNLNFNIKKYLHYDLLVINDHINFTELLLQVYFKIAGKPIIKWIATTKNELNFQNFISRGLKIITNNFADLFIVPSKQSYDYLTKTLIVKKKISYCYNSVENNLFYKSRFKSRYEKSALIKRLKLNKNIIIYCGKFIERKGLKIFVDALNKIKVKDFSVLFIGNGNLRVFTRLLDRKIPFFNAKFVKYTQLNELFSIGKIGILPSHSDTWGLVVNEFMASGIPVICSNKCGSAKQLVKNNFSGFIYDHNNSLELKDNITTLLSNKNLRRKFIENSDQLMKKYTIKNSSLQFINSIKSII